MGIEIHYGGKWGCLPPKAAEVEDALEVYRVLKSLEMLGRLERTIVLLALAGF